MPRTIDFSWKHGPLTALPSGGFEVDGRALVDGMPLRLNGALGQVARSATGTWMWRKDGHPDDGCLLSGRIGQPAAVPAS